MDPPDPSLEDRFQSIVAGLPPVSAAASPSSKFIKRSEVPEVKLSSAASKRKAVALSEKGLIGLFTGLWPSPRSVEIWLNKNWRTLIQGEVQQIFCGKGYFAFIFEKKEDRDLIFRNGPYFMGPIGMYLNKWDLSFNPEKDIPKAVPVWVKLPHLPLHCWNDEDFRTIGNTLGKYVDKSEPKAPMFSCARICVEVDLEKGLPESIMLSLDGWSHLQTVDYEQIPFKCKYCHEYGHFAKFCPKKPEKPSPENPSSEGWNVANGKKAAKPSKQQNTSTKSASGNRFEALETEDQEAEKQVEDPKDDTQPSSEPQAASASHQEKEGREGGPEVRMEKETQEEDLGDYGDKIDKTMTSEGSITRSRAKFSTEEQTDTSVEEQEPLSRKGRKTNKVIREQEAAREKAAGKQANLDFLVKTSQASKYLLTAEEEKKEREKALKQHHK